MQCYSRFIGEGVMFKTYTVKPGNTAVCKLVSDEVRKVVQLDMGG